MSELLQKLNGFNHTDPTTIDDHLTEVVFNDGFVMRLIDLVPEGSTIERVPEDNEFMRAADEMRFQSGCFKQQTGAVLVKDGMIIIGGANEGKLQNYCAREQKGSESGKDYDLCTRICHQFHHAERSAIHHAITAGKDVRGAKVYLSGHWYACPLCWRWLNEAGITTLVLDENADVKFKKPPSLFSKQA